MTIKKLINENKFSELYRFHESCTVNKCDVTSEQAIKESTLRSATGESNNKKIFSKLPFKLWCVNVIPFIFYFILVILRKKENQSKC